MRKFYVTYRRYLMCGEYEFDSIVVTLNEGEKAHPLTFDEKIKGKYLGSDIKKIVSWSLIEE